MKADCCGISTPRKLLFTVGGLIYSLSVLGYSHDGLSMVVAITLFFTAVMFVLSLWIK